MGFATRSVNLIVVYSLVFLAVPALATESRQWSEILAAAKKEGKVVVVGLPDPVVRKELSARFKARYGISLEYVAGGRGGQDARRLNIERRAKVYTIDVYLGGHFNHQSLLPE